MIKSTNLLIVFFTSFCFCYLECSLLLAQSFQEADIFSLRETRPLEKNSHAERSAVKRNQIALDVGGLSNYSLSYAHRVGTTNLSIGGGLGFAWELNSHSFDRNIWEALSVKVFGRYQISEALQLEVGPTLFGYLWTDDCSECSGIFVGLHSAVLFGYRKVFFGPWARIGWADDSRHGSEFGSIWGLQARLLIPWGR